MKSTQKNTFSGASINGSSFWNAVAKSIDARPALAPAGASWPFVSLSISENLIDFKMLSTEIKMRPQETKIRIKKSGYLHFHNLTNDSNDFEFTTLNIDELVESLRKHGFALDELSMQNLKIAKVSIFSTIAIGIAAVVISGIAVIANSH